VYPSPVYPSGGGDCGCSCGCGCGSAHAYPVYPSPVYPSPVYPSPVYPSGHDPGEYARTGRRRSSARPAGATEAEAKTLKDILGRLTDVPAGRPPDVVVLDTGLAEGADDLPPAFGGLPNMVRFGGPPDKDVPDSDADRALDPAAGHGTFIAGLIQRVAPGAVVEERKVIEPLGHGIERKIATAISMLPHAPAPGAVLNLSFGGQVLEEAPLMAAAIRTAQDNGYVVVASAGNDGTCRPTYPAAFAGVVGVGAIGPNGPAPFSNFGPWVRACAPGVDLVSTFFKKFVGEDEPSTPGGADPDDYAEWARWSGTSFSAPLVSGALVRHARLHGITLTEAVERVVDDPALMRIPDLGTVVNTI
jgi:hypothetical protein